MSDHRKIPEPGELVYAPRSSWLPVFLAFALALLVVGVYAEGFMLRAWVCAAIGAIAALLIFRALVQDSVRAFFGLPRKQQVRGAVLPIETIQPPKRR